MRPARATFNGRAAPKGFEVPPTLLSWHQIPPAYATQAEGGWFCEEIPSINRFKALPANMHALWILIWSTALIPAFISDWFRRKRRGERHGTCTRRRELCGFRPSGKFSCGGSWSAQMLGLFCLAASLISLSKSASKSFTLVAPQRKLLPGHVTKTMEIQQTSFFNVCVLM